ncbi:MAG: hypothetical protein P1U58_11570 [Verrucomicrobiales bacterium]|nr:hypothetical protein [Verrucomicrobiales bacterium]
MRSRIQPREGSSNPFIDDIFLNHPDILPGASSIHDSTFHSIVEAVEAFVAPSDRVSPADTIGRIVLMTAPRAGFGKTHLAARIKKQLRSSATTLTLPFDPSRPVSWPVAFNSIIRQFLNEPARRSKDLGLFAESGHFLLSQVILSHRNAGSLKSGQCPVEDEALRSDFFSIFSPGSELLSWTDHQSRDLTRRAESNFLHALGLSASDLGFWIRIIIDFTLRGESALEPLRGLSNGEARERMLQWLRIATFYRPNLIVADGLDGFFRSETAGLEIAGILTGIRESVPRSITLICLNEDIWKSVFEDQLPSAWLDRLTGEKEKLRSISPEAASDLIRNRLNRISLSEVQSQRFVERLKSEHLWIDSETKLYPRAIIRQARNLWESESDQFLTSESNPNASADEAQEPLSSITDKVEFFEALAEDRPLPKPSVKSTELKNGDELFPATREPATPPQENPFFAPPTTDRSSGLVGIESIIEDIRGTGKTVVSEAAKSEPSPTPLPSQEDRQTLEAGLLRLKPGNREDESKGPDELSPPQLQQKPMAPPPAKKPDWMGILRTREEDLLKNPSLKLDLEKLEKFIRNIGTEHPGLSQSEERFPSSRSVCVRWNVRGESVLLGFESPQNVYFWNNLLQQSLASNRREKLAAFSHRTEAFDPNLFSSFGFSPAVAKERIDVIEMNDRELAMIYAADSIITESNGTDEAPGAIQIAIRYLDPLWRRISRPVA